MNTKLFSKMDVHKLKYCFIIMRRKHTWVKPLGYETGIKVYNCVAKEKVPLVLRNKHFASWYTCGPTVYDSAHIGHASCYVKLDIIQRILRDYFKINLVTTMNVTDVDDKIIKRSKELGVSSSELAKSFEKEFWEDVEALNIIKPNVVLRVTEKIPLIVQFIQQLMENGFAYVSKDSSVYFDVSKYNTYGKLQNIGDVHDVEKQNKKSEMDFALWKAAKANEPFWKSEWGDGRPGWHIECSALASSVFGSTIDIHAGGIDLRFPHHENEETQSCAHFGKPQWVNYWLHAGHLHLKNSEKMSKSLKNTISIREMLKMCNTDVFRIACLMSHYRANMEYSLEYIKASENLLQNYKNFVSTCNAFLKGQIKCTINHEVVIQQLNETSQRVHNALIDDFDTALVIKSLNSLIKNCNIMLNNNAYVDSYTSDGAGSIMATSNFVINNFNLFGINLQPQTYSASDLHVVEDVTNILVDFRKNVRLLGISNKDNSLLNLCDSVRTELKQIGITLNDRGKLSSWSK